MELDEESARKHSFAIEQHGEDLRTRSGVEFDFRAGGLDYLVRVAKLVQSPTVMESKKFDELHRNTISDDLTGLYNLRFFKRALAREVAWAKRHRAPCSLLFLNLDYFKRLNDQYGHMVGDEVLRKVADVIASTVRNTDFACRYGGEEFAVIAPHTSRKGAHLLAERIRSGVEGIRLSELHAHAVKISVSVGVSTFPSDATVEEELLARADEALYLAKSFGRNQVAINGGDQRSRPRIPVQLPAVFSTRLNHQERTKTKDINEHGLLLETSRLVHMGAILHIEVLLRPEDGPMHCVGAVTHLRVLSKTQSYEVGISILRISEFDQTRYHQFIARQLTAT